MLEDMVAAEPCLEYTRWVLQYPVEGRSDGAVTEAVRFLRDGMRGFYTRYAGSPVPLSIGDTVYLPE